MTVKIDSARVLLIVFVTALGLIQIPLDIRFRLLSRRATLGILLAVLVVVLRDTVLQGESIKRLSSPILATSAVGLVYLVAHRASPKTVGFGDVLLVTPLGLAIAYSDLDTVLYWQLAAASTAAIHGIAAWATSGRQTIAFGPHLIVTAWLIMVLSV